MAKIILKIIIYILIFISIFFIKQWAFNKLKESRDNEIREKEYIQNLEEKLNIYRESYEEFCLEDSLRQVE